MDFAYKLYNKCNNCNKPTDLFFTNSVKFILERLKYNKEIGKRPIYYLNTCVCVKKNNNKIDAPRHSEDYPQKSTLSKIMCRLLFKQYKQTYYHFAETLIPTDKEYIEFLYYLNYNIPYTFSFKQLNKKNVIFLNFKNHYKLYHEFTDFKYFISHNTAIKKTKYYNRLMTLNKLNYCNVHENNKKIKKVTADKLRKMILRAMYNPHTKLGEIMFNKRLEIDGISESFD